jgi:hypothetical protein
MISSKTEPITARERNRKTAFPVSFLHDSRRHIKYKKRLTSHRVSNSPTFTGAKIIVTNIYHSIPQDELPLLSPILCCHLPANLEPRSLQAAAVEALNAATVSVAAAVGLGGSCSGPWFLCLGLN